MAFPSRLVVRSNDRQTSILTRRSRVGLEGARVEAGDLAKVCLKFLWSQLSYRLDNNLEHTLMTVWYPVTWCVGAKG